MPISLWIRVCACVCVCVERESERERENVCVRVLCVEKVIENVKVGSESLLCKKDNSKELTL